VPENLADAVMDTNMADVRTYMGAKDSELQRKLISSIGEEDPADYTVNADGTKQYSILSISGGSANGAYGAGFLKGWSAEGSRPKFKIVTGVSTGAITAPFAFLGKDYDGVLEKLYTTMSTKDVMHVKGPVRALFGNSLASNAPLRKQISLYVTDDILEKIAAEYKKGRRLYVGTTDLDSQRFVVWDMGAIAAKGDRELFSKVILASAAIPVIFPPVLFKVEADGKVYDEMHADGGTLAQAFTVYQLLDPYFEKAKEENIEIPKMKGKYYLIRNGYISGYYNKVDNNISSIASRASDAMVNSQGVGDTYRIYAEMMKRGNDYNLAYLPSDFHPAKDQEFDPEQMKQLFDRGYSDAVNGYKWHKTPPGLDKE